MSISITYWERKCSLWWIRHNYLWSDKPWPSCLLLAHPLPLTNRTLTVVCLFVLVEFSVSHIGHIIVCSISVIKSWKLFSPWQLIFLHMEIFIANDIEKGTLLIKNKECCLWIRSQALKRILSLAFILYFFELKSDSVEVILWS